MSLRQRSRDETEQHESEEEKVVSEPASGGVDGGKSGGLLPKLAKRVAASFVMAGCFFYVLHSGHLAVCGTLMVLQVELFRELVDLRYKINKEIDIPWFRCLQWVWFATTMCWSYGSSWLKAPMGFMEAAPRTIAGHQALHVFQLVSFCMYAILFIASVLSLKKGLYAYQFKQLTWTIIILLLVVVQMKVVVYNIYTGLVWFAFPFTLVMANDTFAYLVGITIGGKCTNRRFLELSPNKTWEGFLGAALCTMVYAFFCINIWGSFKFLRCTYNELSHNAEICYADRIFELQPGEWMTQSQQHALCLATFASLVAPFGGFFASAIKRASGIKDFASFIPGHGGLMDRMDCQFIMISFTFLYVNALVMASPMRFEKIQEAALQLDVDEQKRLLLALQRALAH